MEERETRERLIRAARDLFYHHGYLRTPLAAVAHAANVPVGNVYYHFKTKDSLLAGVIRNYERQVTADCSRWEHLADPHERLRAFFRADSATAQQLAEYGCPYGTLCQELDKIERPLAAAARHLLELQIDWVAEQLTQLGKGTAARDVATRTFRAPDLLMRNLERLDSWLVAV